MNKRYLVIFLVALVIGAGLRFYHLDWGRPNVFHPDEARISYAVGDIDKQVNALKAKLDRGDDVSLRERIEAFNPHFFAYGTLPIYLIRSGQDVLEKCRPAMNWVRGLFGAEPVRRLDLFVVGRAWQALFDTLTILVVFLLGLRLFSVRTACLAAAFFAFTVFHIQLSHFITVDVMLASFIVLTVYFCARVMEEGRGKDYALMGLFSALALSTKFSAAPLVIPILFAHFAFCWRRRRFGSVAQWGKLFLGLLVFVVAFNLCEPFFLLDHREFMRQLREQKSMVQGRWQPPWTYQYEHTIKGLYQLKNLVIYCMGWPLGFAVIGGTLLLLCYRRRKPGREVLLLLAWLVPVIAATVSFRVKFIRYFAPLIPFLCVLGAQGVCLLYERARDRGWGILVRISAGAVIVFSLYYSLAYVNIYRHPDTRITASNWIYDNIPKGSRILGETWEFGSLPYGTEKGNRGRYRYSVKQLDIYKKDSRGKARELARELAEADCIAIPTKRMYGSVLRIPEKYPVTCNCYRLLFEERLGFKLVKTVTSYPRLFGVEFNDDYADESFTVYEHPKVVIFRKVIDYPAEYLERLIRAEPEIDYRPVLQDVLGATEFNRDERRADLVEPALTGYSPPPYSEARMVIIWLAIIELMGFFALPLAASLFGGLRDRGYSVARLLAIALTGYIAWLGTSLGVAPFSRGLIISAFVIMLIMSWLRARSGYGWRTILGERGKTIVASEAVFLLSFGLFLLFRYYNPDIYWSESSMDFSFINSILRSRYFPPIDPWASGIYLNYYHYGHYLVAMLTKLTGIPSHITYNLAYALIPACVISGIFSIVATLAGKIRYGLLGGFFAGLLGNIEGLFLAIDMTPARDAIYRVLHFTIPSHSENVFRFFRCAHEVIRNTVHEFPFWSFIFVDLHAHVIAMPFAVLVLALCVSVIMQGRSGFRFMGEGAWGVVNFLMAAVLVGMLATINTWDFPTYLGVITLTLFITGVLSRRHSSRSIRFSDYTIWWNAGFAFRALRKLLHVFGPGGILFRVVKAAIRVMVPVGLLACTALLAYAPFFQYFGRKGMGIGLVYDLTTPPGALMRFFGFFLFLVSGYLLVEMFRYFDGRRGMVKRVVVVFLLMLAGLAPWLIFTHLDTRDYASLSMVCAMALLGIVALKRFRFNRPAAFCILLAIYGLLIIAACEIFHIRDFLQGGSHKRMNTIFKFYLPVWFFFSVSGAFFVSRICAYSARWRSHRLKKRLLFAAWCVLFALLLAASLVFTVMGPRARTIGHDNYSRTGLQPTEGALRAIFPRLLREPTLDGLAFMKERTPDEYDAILWLKEAIKGQPVLVEATRQDYRYEYSRISSNTGIPCVLGWWSHVDQRGYKHRDERKRDVFKIYESDDPLTLSVIIAKYDIAYVFVGDTERRNYNPAQLEKFETLDNLFQPVFRNDTITIYRTSHFPAVLKEGAEMEGDAKPIVVPHVRMRDGEFGYGPGEYNEPRGIAVDTKGNVYIADFRNYRVQKFDKEDMYVTSWGSEGDYPGEFNDLCDVAVGPEERVYVADTFNNRVQVFDGNGKAIRHFEGGFFAPRGIAVDNKGQIWVADSGNGVLKIFTSEGHRRRTIGRKGTGPGEFDYPVGIAIDREKGEVYVADARNGRIQVFDGAGKYLREFPVNGWEPGVFNEPYLALDAEGDIYLTDPRGHRVLKYSAGGELQAVLKPMRGGKPELHFPMGIAVRGDDILVVDCRNHRIRKYAKGNFKAVAPVPVVE